MYTAKDQSEASISQWKVINLQHGLSSQQAAAEISTNKAAALSWSPAEAEACPDASKSAVNKQMLQVF